MAATTDYGMIKQQLYDQCNFKEAVINVGMYGCEDKCRGGAYLDECCKYHYYCNMIVEGKTDDDTLVRLVQVARGQV